MLLCIKLTTYIYLYLYLYLYLYWRYLSLEFRNETSLGVTITFHFCPRGNWHESKIRVASVEANIFINSPNIWDAIYQKLVWSFQMDAKYAQNSICNCIWDFRNRILLCKFVIMAFNKPTNTWPPTAIAHPQITLKQKNSTNQKSTLIIQCEP